MPTPVRDLAHPRDDEPIELDGDLLTLAGDVVGVPLTLRSIRLGDHFAVRLTGEGGTILDHRSNGELVLDHVHTLDLIPVVRPAVLVVITRRASAHEDAAVGSFLEETKLQVQREVVVLCLRAQPAGAPVDEEQSVANAELSVVLDNPAVEVLAIEKRRRRGAARGKRDEGDERGGSPYHGPFPFRGKDVILTPVRSVGLDG